MYNLYQSAVYSTTLAHFDILGQSSFWGSICTKVLCIVPNYQFDPILTTYLCLWYNLYQSAVYSTTLAHSDILGQSSV